MAKQKSALSSGRGKVEPKRAVASVVAAPKAYKASPPVVGKKPLAVTVPAKKAARRGAPSAPPSRPVMQRAGARPSWGGRSAAAPVGTDVEEKLKSPQPTFMSLDQFEQPEEEEEVEVDEVLVDEVEEDDEDAFFGGSTDGMRANIDSLSDSGIEGWVTLSERPSHRCTVGLKEGNQIISRAVASRYRADLQSAGIGDGCHAFLLPMPRPLLDGDEHILQVIELSTGKSLTSQAIRWRSTAGTAGVALTTGTLRSDSNSLDSEEPVDDGAIGYRDISSLEKKKASTSESKSRSSARAVGPRIMFDVSDLVYYIGHHPNLTGIQRVQSSIILSIVANKILSQNNLILLSFNARTRRWGSIPTGYFISLLHDLLRPETDRLISFPVQDAREGTLPGCSDFDGVGVLDDGNPTTFCLLGAAWVQQDYFHRLLNLKRQFGMRIVVTIHDLIPIYARETCDQGTALVFEQFLRRALRHTDHFLAVSDYTAKDLKRYATSLSLPAPAVTVTRNGSSFAEFLTKAEDTSTIRWEGLPERYVLFVATIEGRKNHRLIFEIWRRMVEAGDDPPHLICVGRVGWKSEGFIAGLVETNYLDGKVVLLKEVSDAQLKVLYNRCLFTLCPSMYEGWGLPVGESLAAGKVCVCSDRASIPEVAGSSGVYLDISDTEKSWATIRNLVTDSTLLSKLTAKVRKTYEPITWRSVAERIVGACVAASKVPATNPYASIPYSTEISFASPPGRDQDGIFGEDLVARVVEARKGMFLFESLQEENFLRGEDARSGKNWAEPENWGTWLCQTGGEVIFDLPKNDASIFYLYVRLRTAGVLADLRVRLSVNGAVVWADSIGPRSRNIMLRVRRKGSAANGWRMRLHAEAQLTTDLREKILAIDGRVPTIGFERMIILPEDDVKTRIDMLSALMS